MCVRVVGLWGEFVPQRLEALKDWCTHARRLELLRRGQRAARSRHEDGGGSRAETRRTGQLFIYTYLYYSYACFIHTDDARSNEDRVDSRVQTRRVIYIYTTSQHLSCARVWLFQDLDGLIDWYKQLDYIYGNTAVTSLNIMTMHAAAMQMEVAAEHKRDGQVSYWYMVVSRCRGIGPPSSGIVLGTLFLLAAELRRHPTLSNMHLYYISRSVQPYLVYTVWLCTQRPCRWKWQQSRNATPRSVIYNSGRRRRLRLCKSGRCAVAVGRSVFVCLCVYVFVCVRVTWFWSCVVWVTCFSCYTCVMSMGIQHYLSYT